ncbi:MAG TPA: DNA recombination protein RmuC [Candidatus Acidoferrum sp.]|nr:DNA recombination protein RmuC [Candidatus Acidoferrum sp.]
MSGILMAALFVVVVLVAWLALQNLSAQKKNENIESQMNELRRDLQTMATAQAQAAGQITTLTSSVTTRLDSVSKSLTDGVAQSADISSKSQTAMREELKSTQSMMERIHKQLGEFQEVSRGLSNAQQSLESVLGGVKTRGILGEVTLDRLLEDSLPRSQYGIQYRFASGEAVDAVIFLRDRKLLAVDSKFPLEAFRRIETDGDDARRAFATAVKKHVDSIAGKYIKPDENTLDLALMFVPSESVYYELLQISDSKGQPLDEYCRQQRIVAVSPNTLYAHLCVIAMGLRGMQIEENARRLANGLSGLQKQLGNFTETFEKVGTHLKNAQQSYQEAGRRLDKTELSLEGMLTSGDPSAGEQAELPLNTASPAKPASEAQQALRLTADNSR